MFFINLSSRPTLFTIHYSFFNIHLKQHTEQYTIFHHTPLRKVKCHLILRNGQDRSLQIQLGNKHLKYRNLSTRPQHLRKQIFHSAQAEFHPSQTDFTSLQMTFHFILTVPCVVVSYVL